MRRRYVMAVRDMLRPTAAGRVCVSISGNCMAPHLCDGGRVAVQRMRWSWPGDVVVFYSPVHEELIVHRLIGAGWRRGRWRLLTQADNAPNPDVALPPEQVLGRVVEPAIAPRQRLAALVGAA